MQRTRRRGAPSSVHINRVNSQNQDGFYNEAGGTKVPNDAQPRCTRTFPACGGDAAKLIFK